MLRLTITDNGIGFKQEFAEQIFTIFSDLIANTNIPVGHWFGVMQKNRCQPQRRNIRDLKTKRRSKISYHTSGEAMIV